MATCIARYAGRCADCGDFHIKPGDRLVKRAAGGWAKEHCLNPSIKSRKKQGKNAGLEISDGDSNGRDNRSKIDETITAERARFRTQERDELHPGGIETFY